MGTKSSKIKIICIIIATIVLLAAVGVTIYLIKNKDDSPEDKGRVVSVNFKDFPTLPYKVYSNNKDYKEFWADSIVDSMQATKTFYVDKENGQDTNNGLTQESAFKTMKKAMAAYASVNEGVVKILVIGQSTFYQDELYGELIAKLPLIIEPLNSNERVTLCGGVQNVSWTQLGGYENVYECNTTVDVNGVINCSQTNIDSYGLYNGLTKVDSLEACEATANSFYIDASNLKVAYVNVGGIPDSNVMPVQKGYIFRFNHTTSTVDCGVYLKNIDLVGLTTFAGARGAAGQNENGRIDFVAENCTFQHGFTGDLINIGSYDLVYMINCVAGYSLSDVFNYSGAYLSEDKIDSSIICEVNCKLKEAGFYKGSTSIIDNLSTCHTGMNIVRFNTTGYNAGGPIIADVNGCRSVLFGCKASNFRESAGRNCYEFNDVSATTPGLITIIRCGGSDIRENSYILESTTKVQLVEFTQTDNMSVSDYETKTLAEVLDIQK